MHELKNYGLYFSFLILLPQAMFAAQIVGQGKSIGFSQVMQAALLKPGEFIILPGCKGELNAVAYHLDPVIKKS